MRLKSKNLDHKASLLEEIKSLQESIHQKRQDFDIQIEEIVLKIEDIETAFGEQSDRLRQAEDLIKAL